MSKELVAAMPHRAIVRIAVEIYPLNQEGEIVPLPSEQSSDVVQEIFGTNQQEASDLAKGVVEEWKKNLKKEN